MAALSPPCHSRQVEKRLSHICPQFQLIPPPPITGVITYKSSLIARPWWSRGTGGSWWPSGSHGPRKAS